MDEKLYELSLELVIEAGKVIKEGFYGKKNFNMKSKREIVTEYDTRVEKFLVENLKKYSQEINFIAEEGHFDKKDLNNVFIIDPIDGTNNFFYGIPFVAVSLAYYSEGKGIFGFVYNPVLDEMFIGIDGNGAYLNGERINVSNETDLSKCLFATGLPYNRDKNSNLENIAKIALVCRDIRRMGSAAIDICYTARGIFDGYWEHGLKVWDVAAGNIILKEASGKMTNYQGGDLDLFRDDFLSSNSLVHDKIQFILNEEAK